MKRILPFPLSFVAVIALIAFGMIFLGQSLSQSAKSVLGIVAAMLLVVPFYFRRHDEL
jgi:hypothetical protein